MGVVGATSKIMEIAQIADDGTEPVLYSQGGESWECPFSGMNG